MRPRPTSYLNDKAEKETGLHLYWKRVSSVRHERRKHGSSERT